jgi:hypothetical protein
MKSILCTAAIVASFALAVAAFAQSTPAPTETPAPAAAPATPTTSNTPPSNTPARNTAAAVPVPSSKRYACQTAAQGATGQERRDMVQLCMAQARLDCLKQAIEQKVVGPQRIDFVKNCLQ